jgi:surface protein
MAGLYEDLLDLTSTVINGYLVEEQRPRMFSINESFSVLCDFNEAFQTLLPKLLDEEYAQIGGLERWRLPINEELEKTTDAARKLALSLQGFWFVLFAEKSVSLAKEYFDFFNTVYTGGSIDERGDGIDAVSFSFAQNRIVMKKNRFEIGTFEERLDWMERSRKIHSQFVALENTLRDDLHKQPDFSVFSLMDRYQVSMKAVVRKEEMPKSANGYYIVDNESIKCVVNGLIHGVSVHNIDTSKVTDMSKLFSLNENFNEDINHWDVSNVTNMRYMFSGTKWFNHPLDRWNVSRVTDMAGMFSGAHAFNQPLENWDLSNVTDIGGMFCGAIQFNQPLNHWNVSNVTCMMETFNGALAFNQPLDTWDTAKVTDMLAAFCDTQAFNHPLGSWNVSQVRRMYGMFSNTKSFNQSLDTWDVSNVEDMACLFCGAVAFDQPLSSWNLLKCTI